jgi:predicted TIM-barrel fold metal-dependent hydrolase
MHQLVGAAFKYKNIYPMPDIYGFIAGNEVFIKAENTFLQDQLLFDFLYPFIPIKRSIDDFAVFRFDDYVFEKLFYKNAVRIFSLVL